MGGGNDGGDGALVAGADVQIARVVVDDSHRNGTRLAIQRALLRIGRNRGGGEGEGDERAQHRGTFGVSKEQEVSYVEF